MAEMNQSRILVFALALFVIAASMALAQGRGFGPPTGLRMLEIPSVQTELNLTQAEIDQIQPKIDDVRQNAPMPDGGFQNMSPTDFQAWQDKRADLNDADAAQILTADQDKRYLQLELQQVGPTEIERKSVQAQLGITDPVEIKSIADIQSKATADRIAAMQGFDFQNATDDDRAQFFAKQQQMHKDEGDKVLAVLTDAQKAAWKAAQGTPFTFPPPPGGPPPAAAPPPAAPAPA
jgi:hypothetical protein